MTKEDKTMKNTNAASPEQERSKAVANIGLRSFITVICILTAALFLCGAMSYILPQGSFARDESGAILTDTYTEGEVKGIALWRIVTAPVRVFASEDALTVIMISVFLLVMSGVFNLLEKTGGIQVLIGRILRRLRDKGGPVVCLTVLIFMLFGSFFGMFEELVTLLPIIIMFMLSMGMDTMTGLGACLLAACFGFSAAITNPFSVGLVAQTADVSPAEGVVLRIVFFGIIYLTLCVFLMLHLKTIERDPTRSLSYAVDCEKRERLDAESLAEVKNGGRLFRVFAVFFLVQAAVLILVATVRSIAGYAIPILAASFLIGGVIAGLLVCDRVSDVLRHIGQGAVSMVPAVLMIALASSVKLVMTESGILDTIMHSVILLLEGKSKFLALLLIYLLILFLQVFIGSASAKILLVMPIVMPITTALGISPALVILAYCMADGFTDVILPTNPVLLVGLSMANVSYTRWVRWTWKLQAVVFLLSLLMLLFGVVIGY